MRYYAIMLVLILFSCNSNQKLAGNEFMLVRFKERFPNGADAIMQDYTLQVPKGGKLTKGSYDFTGDYHAEYRIVYLDSSIIYIGNSNWSGSNLNVVNRVKAGIVAISKKHENDSLYFEGVQADGRFWKGNFLGEIIVGYMNVKTGVKEKYDYSVHSVK